MKEKTVHINKDYTLEEFGFIISSYRREKGWTQTRLAEEIYKWICKNYPSYFDSDFEPKAGSMAVLRIEKAMNPPSKEYLEALSNVFKIESTSDKDFYVERIVTDLRTIIEKIPRKNAEALLKIGYTLGELSDVEK